MDTELIMIPRKVKEMAGPSDLSSSAGVLDILQMVHDCHVVSALVE